MSFSGVHIACGFTGQRGGCNGQVGLLGPSVWSQTMGAPGTTIRSSPYERFPDGPGEAVFSIFSSADIYFAIGTAPDATSGTRRFLPANTAVDIFGDRAGNEKVAWVLA
ncbi:hypothetical protein ABIB83_008722 [Bradyrhizobium sp. I1.8.5]|uniref:hypothetical protein n=2 Tax=unclassified Bradyrhizobium TaxID=2631580 RepID=UPI003392BD8D